MTFSAELSVELAPELTAELQAAIQRNVQFALEEDIGSGDITAQLIPEQTQASATIITREEAIICGQPWVEEVFRQLDPSVTIEWQVKEGQTVTENQQLCTLHGSARSLLTGERAALNFLQTLSATATAASRFAKLAEGTDIKILDTRKTLPGLRLAQKYAVKVGGCHNHRIGLYDAFLIKENHIAACGSIQLAVEKARQIAPGKTVEVEVESLGELQQALDAGADIIMLDNFSAEDIKKAIAIKTSNVKYESSGNVTLEGFQLPPSGIDFISTGQVTKSVTAIDLSMRIAS